MRRRLLFIFAMLFSVATAFAQDCDYSGTTGQLQWCLKNGTLTISGNGVMPNYGYPIYSPWDSHKASITTIIMETGVTSIGNYAFYNCQQLISVIIPNTTTSIGNSGFHSCKSLISVTLPNSVISIGSVVFEDCTALTSINVENGNNSYASENGVLFNKNKTTLICYPAGKTDISYVIPNFVTSIEGSAFTRSTKLTSIIIPNSVTSIGQGGFYFCTNLTLVTIPSSVTNIGDYVFYGCTSLSSITNLNPLPVALNSHVFYYETQKKCTLTVTTSAVSVYKNAAVWREFNIVGGGFLVNPKINNSEYGYTTGNKLYEANATATVTATANSGYKFVNWTKGGIEVSTTNSYSFSVTEDVELVANFEYNVGIENIEATTINIYPNPMKSELKIESGELRVENLAIYDIFGKVQKIENFEKGKAIDISHLPVGVYFVKISTEVGDVTRKVLKE